MTIADKLMFILNDDTQNRLQLVVETFVHSTEWTKTVQIQQRPQNCEENE